MFYVVIEMLNDGSCYIADPNKPLSFTEAIALVKMNARTKPNHKWFVAQLAQYMAD